MTFFSVNFFLTQWSGINFGISLAIIFAEMVCGQILDDNELGYLDHAGTPLDYTQCTVCTEVTPFMNDFIIVSVMTSVSLDSSLCSSSPGSLSEGSSVVSLNATLCSSEHRIVCGLSLCPNSHFSWTVWMANAMSTCYSVCLACGGSTGRLAAHLDHKNLLFVALGLWELGVASPREHPRS